MTAMTKIKSIQGDSIDSICWRYYGRSLGMVERVLQANPQLSQYDAILPMGTTVYLPHIETATQHKPTIQLWE